jgi:ketosteroid isomerase-like protein
MKRNKFFIATAFLILSFLPYGCHTTPSKAPTNIEEAKKAIAESNAIYFQAFVKGDSSLFISRYAEDCCIMPPNASAMCGPDAALAFFKIAYQQLGLRNGKFITTQVYGDGEEFVTEEGVWQLFDANQVLFDHGKFLVLWKKTPKGWKMYRDSFSSNQEPADRK